MKMELALAQQKLDKAERRKKKMILSKIVNIFKQIGECQATMSPTRGAA